MFDVIMFLKKNKKPIVSFSKNALIIMMMKLHVWLGLVKRIADERLMK